jgi:tetratricopeptide (TPR) repeat protein
MSDDDQIHVDGDSHTVSLSTQDDNNRDRADATLMEDAEFIDPRAAYYDMQETAFLHVSNREWYEAIEVILSLMEINPFDDLLLFKLAECLDNTNQFDILYEIISQYNEQNPNVAHALAFQARALQKLGRLSEATIANDQALLLDKSIGLAWLNRCGLQLLQKKFPEALRSSQVATETGPYDPRAWFNRGVALLNFNRLEEALRAFDESLELDEGQFQAMQMKCEIFSRIGRMRDIVLLVKQGLALEPDNVDLLTKGIEAVRSLEMYTELRDLSQQFIEQAKDNSFAWENLVCALRGLGNFEEANKALDRLIELETADVRFWTLKADTLYRMERYRDAVQAAEYACRINAEYPPAQRIYEKSLRLMYQRKDKWKQQRS